MLALKAILALLIFYIPNQGHFPIEFSIKGLNIFNGLFMLGVLALLFTWNKARGPKPVPVRKWVLLYILAVTVSLIIGLMSPYARPSEDITYFKNLVFDPLLFLLFFHGCAGREGARHLMYAMLVVAAVACLEAVKEGLTFGFANYNLSKRAAGPFGDWHNANKAGAFFALFLPIFGALITGKVKTLIRLAAAGALLIGILAIFFTYSRTAYFAAAVGLIGLFLVRSKVMGALFLIAVINYTAWAPESVQERVETTGVSSGHVEVEQQDESTQMRFELWSGAMAMSADYPLGIGLNHFKRRIGQYSTISGMDAHNYIILLIAEAGWLAALIFLILVIGMVNLGRKLWREGDGFESAIGHGFVFGVIAFMLVNMFSSQFNFHPVAGAFWIMAGLIARMYAEQRHAVAENEAEPAARGPQRPPRRIFVTEDP